MNYGPEKLVQETGEGNGAFGREDGAGHQAHRRSSGRRDHRHSARRRQEIRTVGSGSRREGQGGNYEHSGRCESANLANKAKREITDEANKAKREINDEANKAKREIKGGLNQVKAEVQSGVKQVKAEAEKVPGQVKEEIKDIVQELGELASGKVFRAALKAVKTFKSKADELAKKKPQLVKSINKVGFKINLNIVVLKYSDFYSRANEIAAVLTKLAENPPELRRSTITSAIIALAPSETEPGFKIPIFPSGFSFPGMSNDLLAEFVDTALEAAGVPE